MGNDKRMGRSPYCLKGRKGTQMNREEREEIEEMLMQFLTVLRERAGQKYVCCQPGYKRLVEDACDAENRYLALELTKEQRAVIEDMLDKKAEAGECGLTWIYLAGLLDGAVLLRNYGFLDLYLESGIKRAEAIH